MPIVSIFEMRMLFFLFTFFLFSLIRRDVSPQKERDFLLFASHSIQIP